MVARSPVFAELLRRAEEEQEGEKVRGKNLDEMPQCIRKCSFKVEKLRITDVRPETETIRNTNHPGTMATRPAAPGISGTPPSRPSACAR